MIKGIFLVAIVASLLSGCFGGVNYGWVKEGVSEEQADADYEYCLKTGEGPMKVGQGVSAAGVVSPPAAMTTGIVMMHVSAKRFEECMKEKGYTKRTTSRFKDDGGVTK